MTANVFMLDQRAAFDMVGLIPSFLDENDPRPAREQFDANYQHGGGWRPFHRFTLSNELALLYADDPPQLPIAMLRLRDERIYIYPHAWVLIMQKDNTWEAARLD